MSKPLFNYSLERREQVFSVLLIAPISILLLVLAFYPIIYSIVLSFQDVILTRPGRVSFVGLQNYVEMLTNSVFLNSLWKTAYFSVAFLIGTVVVGILIALVLNQKVWGKRFAITCLLIPWAIPRVVNGLIWKWIYDGNFGILNAGLTYLGIIEDYKFWFGESPLIGLLLIAVANTWKGVPFVTLLFLAALQTIPKELYESAKIDGAGSWQRFVNVTIPQLRHPLIIIMILQTMRAIKVFDIIVVLTKGGPGDRTTITYYYIFKTAFEYMKMSEAAAGAYMVTALITILAVFYYKVFKGGEEY